MVAEKYAKFCSYVSGVLTPGRRENQFQYKYQPERQPSVTPECSSILIKYAYWWFMRHSWQYTMLPRWIVFVRSGFSLVLACALLPVLVLFAKNINLKFFFLPINKIIPLLQWIPQDVLSAPISNAAYSCNSQLIYATFVDGNVGVFDADSLKLRCRIAPSAYLPSSILNG